MGSYNLNMVFVLRKPLFQSMKPIQTITKGEVVHDHVFFSLLFPKGAGGGGGGGGG